MSLTADAAREESQCRAAGWGEWLWELTDDDSSNMLCGVLQRMGDVQVSGEPLLKNESESRLTPTRGRRIRATNSREMLPLAVSPSIESMSHSCGRERKDARSALTFHAKDKNTMMKRN